jgi:hypothetical protein
MGVFIFVLIKNPNPVFFIFRFSQFSKQISGDTESFSALKSKDIIYGCANAAQKEGGYFRMP